MKRYIEITISGKRYRFLIDEDLDKELRSSLKNNYRFDSNNLLVINDEDLVNSYASKQLILRAILNQISTYDLTSDMQKELEILKSYLGNRTTIYSSDLSKLEDILGSAIEIYNNMRSSIPKKDIADKQRELIEDALDDMQNIDSQNESSSTDDKLEEFKEIIEDISFDEELKDEVPINDINDAINRVTLCSTTEEFINKTGSNIESYNITNAIKNKSEKIFLPPNSKLEMAVTEILKTCINDNGLLEKVVSYVERNATYKNKTSEAFENLRSSFKVYGLSSNSMNYYGDQFFNIFEQICNESGISFETMFKDYFNNYSANRRYNSPMDKFIRLFNKYNDGDENTRSLLEAMLVKKAISRHLISSNYNRYLKEEYQNLNVNSKGYINFNESSLENVIGGISSDLTAREAQKLEIDESVHIGANNHSYESELNAGVKKSQDSKDEILPDNLSDVNTYQDSLSLNLEIAPRRRNGLGVIQSVKAGVAKNSEESTTRLSRNLNGRKFTSNNALNPTLLDEDDMIDDESDINGTETDNSELDGGEGISSNDNMGGSIDNFDNDSSDDSNLQYEVPSGLNNLAESAKDVAKKTIKKGIIEFIKKHPAVWIAAGIILLLFLLIIIIGANNDDNENLGYYDSACNFNDAKVTITSCETSNTLQNLDLKDYVTKMTYLYTKDGNYSDEALKALMIILKTNVLSYGGYSSGDKNVNVRICDVFSGVVEESSLFNGVEEELSDLNKLYDTISEYLFISTSYKSSITYLSSVNAIPINDIILTDIENAAATGLSYREILDNVFKVDTEENITINDARENLFLGDSRMQGMLLTSVINNNNTVYGVGYGYNWFIGSSGTNSNDTNSTSGGINGINNKISTGKLYNIIIWLGVNDLDNANNYLEKYKELASGEWSSHNIYVVSVGPVLDSKSQFATNERINEFNNKMKAGITEANLSNLRYVDLGYTESSIKNYDDAGIHYSDDDYRAIYTKMTSNIISGPSSISTKLELYRLSDYCTYYTLTENDAYWWPIGSSEPTKGNISGGTPTTTLITSSFGLRVIDGKTSNHKGIDISGGSACFSNVIIASKSGTVTAASDTCPTNGSYGNTCGGGYGNYVIIDHGDGTSTVYAHMSSGTVTVAVGDTVSQGQKIGVMGSSGSSTGCHLHFEVRIDGTKVNPSNYVSADNPRPVNGAFKGTGEGGTPAENKTLICESLLASGYSKNAVIGMLINISAEGGFKTTNLEDCYEENQCCQIRNKTSGNYYDYGYCVHPEIGDFASDSKYTMGVDSGDYLKEQFMNDHAGYGLIQWTASNRKANLYDYAKSKNSSIGSLDVQLGYLLEELKGSSYAITYKYITGNYNAYDIAKNFCLNFEAPANKEYVCPKRARENLKEYTNFVNNGCK